MDDKIYIRFMKLMLASLYATSPQGRISGINSLCYGDIKDILHDDHTLSKDFKTFTTYTYQPVIFSEVAKELLSTYLKLFRPVAVKRAVSVNATVTLVKPDASLWLMFT